MAKQQSGGDDQGEQNVALYAFNRGIISPLGLARTDFKRTALSSTIQTNWMPRLFGSMMLRPGTELIDGTYNNQNAIHIPFVFSTTDTAIIEMTPNVMRVRVGEQPISRVSVGTAILNGNPFAPGLTSWTDSSDTGGVAQYQNSTLYLNGDGNNYGRIYQKVPVALADQGKLHAIRIVVLRGDTVTGGDVQIQVGSTQNGVDLIPLTLMRVGTYSLTFTPQSSFIYVQLQCNTKYICIVSEVNIEAAGVLTLPTPFSSPDLQNIRWDQSADIIFLACAGHQQMRIERHSTYGWGISLYMPPDGPMLLPNITPTTLTSSLLSGDPLITASSPIFQPTHVGAVFSMTSQGQVVDSSLSAANIFTDPIQVTGSGTARNFNVYVSGTYSGVITLQYSIGALGNWQDNISYANGSSQTLLENDGYDNSIVYYRLGFKSGNYTSGTAVCEIVFIGGSITGIFRITGFLNSTNVYANVLTDLGMANQTTNIWSEGQWSDYRGWPGAVSLFEGRLWWAGQDNIDGSISDAYESFNIATVGNSGAIIQGIGSGPVDIINWLLPLARLEIGGQAAVHSCRSSSIDTPLTPTDFAIRVPITVGATNVPAIKMDLDAFYVSQSTTRLYNLSIQNIYYSYEYESHDRSIYCPEVTSVGIKRIAIQRFPDTRIHCVLNDGTVAVLVYDRNEDVQAWVKVECDVPGQAADIVQDVFVMPNPGFDEDKVYYLVQRANGYFLERWSMESECVGGTLNKNLDCHMLYTGSPTNTLPVTLTTGTSTYSPFNSQTIQVWANGINMGLFSVANGATTITMPTPVSNAVYGFPYPGEYQSTKLAYAVPGGTALTQKKKVDHLGIIAQNMHCQALWYGDMNDMKAVMAGTPVASSNMQSMPGIEDDVVVDPNTVWATYDKDMFEFPGEHDTDSRLCLYTPGGLPVTLLAAIIGIEGAPTL